MRLIERQNIGAYTHRAGWISVMNAVQAGHYRPIQSHKWQMSDGLPMMAHAARLREKY